MRKLYGILLLLVSFGVGAASIQISSSPDRAGPFDLSIPNLYVSVAGSNGPVTFSVDDKPISVENLAPYDLMGTNADGTAKPWVMPDGTHKISVRAGTETVVGYIARTLATPSPTPTPVPTVTPTVTPTVAPTATPTPTPAPTVPPTPIASAKGIKWHPGHYVNGFYGKDVPWAISEAKKDPGIKGVSFLHAWETLETSKDVFNFSAIDAQLKAVKAANLYLIIQVQDRSFHANRPHCVPTYMLNDPLYKGGESHIGVKCTALRFVGPVQDRMNALYKALGARYDSDPNFAGFSITEEDDFGTTGTNMSGYSSRAYIDQEKRGITAAAAAFPTTPLFKWMNWGPGNAELFAHCVSEGVGVGGPDLDPKSPTFSYPVNYQANYGKIPLLMAVQWPRSDKTINDGSNPAAIIKYGTSAPPSGIGLSFIIWDAVYQPVTNFTNIVSAIKANPTVQTGCPSTYVAKGGCK